MKIRNRSFQTRNHLDSELGILSDDQRIKVVGVLRKFIAGMRVLLSLSEGEPSCGDTCTLMSATDEWPEFASTVYGFLKSYRDSTPFLCHGAPSGGAEDAIFVKRQFTCGGFESVMTNNRRELRYLVARTLLELRQIVPTRTSGRIRMSMSKHI